MESDIDRIGVAKSGKRTIARNSAATQNTCWWVNSPIRDNTATSSSWRGLAPWAQRSGRACSLKNRLPMAMIAASTSAAMALKR